MSYDQMQEESSVQKEDNQKIIDDQAVSNRIRKFTKSFYKNKVFDKFNSFSEWVEVKKPLQKNKKAIYDEIQKFQFYGETSQIVNHNAEVLCLGFCPLSRTIAVGLANGECIVFEKSKNSKELKTESCENGVNTLYLSADYLYTAAFSKSLTIWSYTSDKVSQDYIFSSHSANITSIALIKDRSLYDIIDKVVVSGDMNGEVFLLDLSNKEHKRFFNSEGYAINQIVTSSDNSQIFIAADDNLIKVWNSKDLSFIYQLAGHEERIFTIALSENGERLASSGADVVIKIWDLKEKKEKFSLEGHDDDVKCLVFLPNNKTVVSGSSDNSIKVWNTVKGTLKSTIEGHTGSVNCLALNIKKGLLISGSKDQTLREWKLKQLRNSDYLVGNKAPVLALSTIPNSNWSGLITVGEEKFIRIWDLYDGMQLEEVESDCEGFLSLDVSQDGTKLVTGGIDGSLTLWEVDLEEITLKKIVSTKKHLEGVSCVKFTQKEKYIVSGSHDQSLKIWDYTLANEVRDLKKHPGIISTLCLTKDDLYIITGTKFSGIYVWDFNTLKNLRSLKGHQGEITSIKATLDSRIITSCKDGSIKIWNLHTGILIKTLETLEKAAVSCLEITTDDSKIISGNENQTIVIWDAETGKELYISDNFSKPIKIMALEENSKIITDGLPDFNLKVSEINKIKTKKILKGFTKPINTVALSPDQLLLATGDQDCLIKIWDLQKYKFITELRGHASSIKKLVFSSSGMKLYSCGLDNSVRIWDIHDLDSPKMPRVLKNFSNVVKDMVLFDDEKKGGFACWNGSVYFYNLENYENYKTVVLNSGRAYSLALNESEKILYTGTSKKIWAIDIKHYEATHQIGEHAGFVYSIILTNDKQRLISCSEDKTIKIWDVKKYKLLFTLNGHAKAVYTMAINEKSSILYTSGEDETIQIWDINQYKRLATIDSSSEPVYSIILNKNNTLLYAVGDDKCVRMWDIDDSQYFRFFEGHFGGINRIEMSSDGKFMISGSGDHNIIVWDLLTGRQKCKLKGHTWDVKGIAMTKDNSKLVSCTYNANARIWDLHKEIAIASIDIETSADIILFSPDETEFVVGCCDSFIRAFSMKTLALTKKFEGHSSVVYIVRFTPDQKNILSGSEDKLIILWNYQTMQRVKTFEGHEKSIYALNFLYKANKLKIVSGGNDKTVRIWDMETGDHVKIDKEFPGYVSDVIATRDNKRLFISCYIKDALFVYDAISLKEILKFENASFPIEDILLTSDEKYLYGAGQKSIGCWNANTYAHVPEKSITGFSKDISKQILSPNKKMIIFATKEENAVRVWDFEKGLIAKHNFHIKEITGLAMKSDNTTLITASKDKYIIWFDIVNSTIIGKKIKGHSAPILSLSLSEDDSKLITSSEDSTIAVWDVILMQKIDEFKNNEENTFKNTVENTLALRFFKDGETFLSGGKTKELNLWNMERKNCYETIAILSNSIVELIFSPDQRILVIYLENSVMQIWDAKYFTYITELPLKENDFHTLPVFISQDGHRLMLYFNKLIDCLNGDIIFNVEMNRDTLTFFFDHEKNDYYYVTPLFELHKMQNYWLQNYIFQYLNYDSITNLNKDSEEFVKRPLSTFPFFFSFMHLITIFDKNHLFEKEILENIYHNKVELSHFFRLDIFMNTPLDIMLLKRNTTLLMKYFSLLYEYIEKENISFSQKVRFLQYSFKENYDIRNIMIEIIKLCEPDLSIISKIFDISFMPLDPSIYDNSYVSKELDDPKFITSDSLFVVGSNYISSHLEGKTSKESSGSNQKKKDEEEQEKESMIKAKIICIPKIGDISDATTEKLLSDIANLESDNEIFGNKTLQLVAGHIWDTQIWFLYLWEFIVFFCFFLIFNINYIYLYPLRADMYSDDEETLNKLKNVTFILDFLLLLYGLYSLINEIRQMLASGFSGYFKSIWNYFDILLVPCLLLTSFADIMKMNEELSDNLLVAIKLLCSLCMFCFWFRFLSFFRAIPETSSMIRLILNVILSTRYFILFMVIFMFSLSCTFYVLHNDNEGENPVFLDTFLLFYQTTMGDTDGISEYDLILSDLSNFFMIFSTFLFAIILLNLLVSIIGDIHGEIKESKEKTRLYELINILVDVNFSLTAEIVKLFMGKNDQKQFLIQLYNEKHEQIKLSDMENMGKNLETKIQEIKEENQKIAKENFENIKVKIEKLFEVELGKIKEYMDQKKN